MVYREPKILAHISLSGHKVISYEAVNHLKSIKGAKVTFAVRSNSERDRQSLSKAVSDFDWTPLYLLPSCLSKFDFFRTT